MIAKNNWDLRIEEALRSNNSSTIFGAYQEAWKEGHSPTMSQKTFLWVFGGAAVAKKCIDLLPTSSEARETLESVLSDCDFGEVLSDYNCEISVVLAVLGFDKSFARWQESRSHLLPEVRSRFVQDLIRAVSRLKGREWLRSRAVRFWTAGELLEEEKEGIVRGLAYTKALTEDLLLSFGSEAVAIARRLLARGDIGADWLVGGGGMEKTTLCGSITPKESCDKIGSLMQWVSIPTDLRDSRLKPSEMRRVSNQWSWPLLEIAMQRMRRSCRHPEMEMFIEELLPMLGVVGPQFTTPVSSAPFRFRMLQLLHMRLILDSPSIASALKQPEESLVPEVLLYILGNDAVDYSPELRVFSDADKRWKARWAENMGEAMSVLFLERALKLELTTLARIQEEQGKKTADFVALTKTKEPIVFESKGATGWKTHRDQRKKALQQLGKFELDTSGPFVWGNEPGRAFACSLFASKMGDKHSSLFHVADPPFAFKHLFHEGWENLARRYHYAAVLESAHLYEMADALLHRAPRDEKKESMMKDKKRERQRPERLRIPSGADENGLTFHGSRTEVFDMARALGHPNAGAFRGMTMFVGIDGDSYRYLEMGSLPPLSGSEERNSETLEKRFASQVGVGILNGSESPEREASSGIYSLLSNGSILAIEVS